MCAYVRRYAKCQGGELVGTPLQVAGCSVIIHADATAIDGGISNVFEIAVRDGRRLLLQVSPTPCSSWLSPTLARVARG